MTIKTIKKSHMKRVLHLIALLFISINLIAQAPEKMSYQAVIRNASNNLVTNAPVKMRITILLGGVSGTPVYSELHSATTNANGLVTIEIGGGTSQTAAFSSINWGNGTYYLKTETDPNNGGNYTIVGTSQFLSVPYALYAGNLVNNGGKPVIYLSGTITNTQAQTKISQEYGVNTHEIIIEDCSVLTSIDLSIIKEIVDIRIENNENLESINLSGLVSASSIDLDNCPKLNSINLNALVRIGNYFSMGGANSVTSLNFGSLTSIEDLHMYRNLLLSSISFPNLVIINYINVSDNPQLSTFSVPNLVSLTESSVYINRNKLPSTQINSLLNKFVNMNPVLTKTTIDLSGQSPSAPPTGQGLTDKATLISRGNQVRTD